MDIEGENLEKTKEIETMQSISSYINPNTRGLTSNYKNTAIKDKETYNEAMSQHLLNPVEDLVQVLKTPIKLAKSSSLSRQNNSVNIAEGQRIRVNGGHVLTITAHGVEVSGGDNPYDTQSYVKAQRMADALASMLRNAGGTMTTVAHSKEEYARYTEGITDVMSYLGIDTSKDFTVNGMKYSKIKMDGMSQKRTVMRRRHSRRYNSDKRSSLKINIF